MSRLARVGRFLSVLALAVLMVGGLMLLLSGRDGVAEAALAPSDSPETAALPPEPAASSTLAPPWLSDDDVADAPFGRPPQVDGRISPGEYAGAYELTFRGYGGEVEVFVKQDASNLHIAFDSPDTTAYPFNSGGGTGPAFQVFLDTNNDKATAPKVDDYRLTLRKDGDLKENQGTGGGWGAMGPAVGWTAAVYTTTWGWQGEFSITLSSKLGIAPGVPVSVGLSLAEVWTPSWPHDWYWPASGDWDKPSTWGYLTSSSHWGSFYWKPGPWEDYAPSGLPDFDQRQDGWSAPASPISTHCGPVAMANSLWWFDSKFESDPGDPAAGWISDSYRLVRSYDPALDDHDPLNVIPLVDELAWYFDTNGIRSGGGWQGTYVTDMHSGTLAYLRDHGLWDDYLVSLVEKPDFQWIADEAMRSEDVLLLLGFWQEQPPGSGLWVRIGGHYVTVAGVDPTRGNEKLALSDPARDSAELGGVGRVLSGTLIPHFPIPGHPADVHNDAGNVSHDIYWVLPSSPSPGGSWWIPEYPLPDVFEEGFDFNPHPEWEGPVGPPLPEMIHTEIEYALTVSPYRWKASGEWVPRADDPMHGDWLPWQDYAPNGVPDFDQKQDNWTDPASGSWSFCGPTAAANSLWWFDSKYEPSPAGPPLPPYQPPIPFNDNYPLVRSYDPHGIWDDHDPLNVDSPVTAWPPGGEFIEELAFYFQTDLLGAGTVITELRHGIEQYIFDHDLRQGYVITQAQAPDFWWVAKEVEASEDLILLLGFWQSSGPGEWVRLGGHYVTLPGVDKQGGLVAFSDPWFDRIEQTWPYAGIGTVPGWPSVLGRVAGGWLTSTLPYGGHSSTAHNDAGNVSHDVYRVVATDSPGGVWGPKEYMVDPIGPDIENFLGQNGPVESQPAAPDSVPVEVQTEVEWAVAVSPVADVWITKTVTPMVAAPGDWVTFTIVFGNEGSLAAEKVVVSDTLPPDLVNASWSGRTSTGLPITAQPGTTFIWDLPGLSWREGGVITVTAQVSPALCSGRFVTNTVEIATSSVEQYQLAPLPNRAADAFQIVVVRDILVAPAAVAGQGAAGEVVTYTLTVTNNGNAPDTITLSPSGQTWATTLSPSLAALASNQQATVVVSVTVPITATVGMSDTVAISAQGICVSDTSRLTTSVIIYIHLPVVLRNY